MLAAIYHAFTDGVEDVLILCVTEDIKQVLYESILLIS